MNKIPLNGISEIRSDFANIDDVAASADTGGNRRSKKGEACEKFVDTYLRPVVESMGYTMSNNGVKVKYSKLDTRAGTKQFDRAIYDQNGNLRFLIEVKDYGDSTQFGAALTAAQLVKKTAEPQVQIIFISIHKGSEENIRQEQVEILGMKNYVHIFNVLPIKRKSNNPTYLDQFSDPEFSGYINSWIQKIKDILK